MYSYQRTVLVTSTQKSKPSMVIFRPVDFLPFPAFPGFVVLTLKICAIRVDYDDSVHHTHGFEDRIFLINSSRVSSCDPVPPKQVQKSELRFYS